MGAADGEESPAGGELDLRVIRELRASSGHIVACVPILALGVVCSIQVPDRAVKGRPKTVHSRHRGAFPCGSAPIVGIASTGDLDKVLAQMAQMI